MIFIIWLVFCRGPPHTREEYSSDNLVTKVGNGHTHNRRNVVIQWPILLQGDAKDNQPNNNQGKWAVRGEKTIFGVWLAAMGLYVSPNPEIGKRATAKLTKSGARDHRIISNQ